MVGKTILITGGTRGIGFAVAKAYTKQGHQVILNYKSNEPAANKALEEIRQLSPSSIALKADITDKAQRSSLVEQSISRFGKIDVLVNNAGSLAKQGFLEMQEEEYDYILDCNLKATIFLSQAVAKEMIPNKKGCIINIASIGAYRSFSVMHYGVSKAGLLYATKDMARELGQYNIRVNSISPGTIITDLNRDFWTQNPQEYKKYIEKVPLHRTGLAEEIAGAALYLSSDQANYTSGTDIVIDGGYLC